MKIRALLKTPLYRHRGGADQVPYLAGNVSELRGTAEARDGGLDLQVAEMFDGKGEPVAGSLKRIFLPLAKVDYYIIE